MNELKKCSVCETSWQELSDLLEDSDLEANGYQANPLHPEKGLFLFTHNKEGCGTTISIHVDHFKELINGNIEFKAFIPGDEADCHGHCLDNRNSQECNSVKCNGVCVRKLLQLVKKKMNT